MPADDHTATEPDLRDPSLYLNREMELLKFQERVLEEVRDEANPLLERVKFLSILSSNLAEFYMVRVAGLKQQIEAGVSDLSPDGLTATEQLKRVRLKAESILLAGRDAYHELKPALAEAGIHLLDYADLEDGEKQIADAYFEDSVFPVLTPLAFDPGRPFPHISNLSLNLAVVVCDDSGEERFARVKIPGALPRLVPLRTPADDAARPDRADRTYRFVWVEQLVTAHLGSLFPGMRICESHPFRVTRDAEMEIQEIEADDLLETIERGVRRRRFGDVVRVVVDANMPESVRSILIENLELHPGDLVTLDPPIGMSGVMQLYALDRPDLKDPPFHRALPPGVDAEGSDMFTAIREGDMLLHHPFDSFEPVVRILRQAAADPDVLAIKTTLYRVGRNSPVVEALLEAAREGKEVTALVELKARFDEESNIEWARALEAEGVHVVYGLLGLKVHSKVMLIVRREGGHIRRYVHVGTGNYNPVTARLYTDLALLTDDDATGDDASHLFNFITGYAAPEHFNTFLVSPADLRRDFDRMIRREMEHASEGRGGHLVFKMNSLVDPRMIRLLYEASRAGVRIDLVVRGMCCLRPGVPGVSETITVRSIVGRFLEHSRIFWFDNAGDPDVFIGSADLMTRNIDRRVEVLTPVRDPALRERLGEILATYLADNVKARCMSPDGTYERVTPPEDAAERVNAQAAFLRISAGDD